MTKHHEESAEEELVELHDEQEAQVLEREPLETELMEEGRSDIGEEVDHVEHDQ